MKSVSCCVAVALAGVVVVAAACGDSSGPGPQAASVTSVAGDSQIAPAGAPLTFPLSMTVLGSGGQPIQGVSVTWTVDPSHRVKFAPATTSSDVNGHVTTNVTAGATADTVLVQAHVPGVQQPVDFHVFIIDPCRFATIHTLGTSVNAVLTTFDCKSYLQNTPLYWYYDFYILPLTSQTAVTLNMTATFDTYLDVWRDPNDLAYAGFNDNISGSNFNSRFEAILAPGEYLIGANTVDTAVTGAYTLASVSRPQTIENCPELWVTEGVVINDNIAATDCPDTTNVGSYGDTLRLVVLEGSTAKIAERSSDVNANLRLFRRVFSQEASQPDTVKLVASNDDSSAATQNAYVSYTVPLPNPFQPRLVLLEIFAGTTGAVTTGAYTLEIFSSTTLSAMRKSDPASPWGVRLGNRPVPQLGLRRGL